MTDIELDERITALEENGGGGSQSNGTFILIYIYVICEFPSSSIYASDKRELIRPLPCLAKMMLHMRQVNF